MLCKPSSTLPVFEEKLLVVAGEGWGSTVDQCCSCCSRLDESRQRKKLVAPFLCKDSSSVLTCLVFLRSSDWQDLVSLQWEEVLWACCQCSLQLSTACWAQKKGSWRQAAPWGEVERSPWRSEVEGVEGVEWERERIIKALGFWLPDQPGGL